MSKIIIYAPNWIGDAVMAIPMLKELRAHYPDVQIDVVSKMWVADVYSTITEVDSIIPFSRSDYKSRKGLNKIIEILKKQKYDTGFLLSDSFSSARLFFRSGITRRIGYMGQFRSWMLTDRLSKSAKVNRHRSDTYLRLLELVGIIPDFGKAPRINPKAVSTFPKNWNPNKIQIGINPNSNASSRQWPIIYWVSLIEMIQNMGAQIILFGGPFDVELNKIIIAQSGTEIINCAGGLTLEESMSLMAHCDLIISNDSGPMHLADAVGTPTIGLFGAGNIQNTGLRSQRSHNIDMEVYCSPCRKNQCPNKQEPLVCMESLTPELVFDTMISHQKAMTKETI